MKQFPIRAFWIPIATVVSINFTLANMAMAGIIFESSPFIPSAIHTSDVDDLIVTSGGQLKATGFTLDQAGIANKMITYGAYGTANTPSVDNFTVDFAIFPGEITANDLGISTNDIFLSYSVPNANVVRTDTDVDISGFDIYRYEFPLPNVALPAGNLVIGVYNDTTADSDDVWVSTLGYGTPWRYFERDLNEDVYTVRANGEAFIFTLEGTVVPEPASVLLMGAFVSVGLIATRWRRELQK